MNNFKYRNYEPLLEPEIFDLEEEDKEWDEDDWQDYADCLRHDY